MCGDEQGAKGAASRAQSKRAPLSLAQNVNEADGEATVPAGPEPIVVSGGVVSAGRVVTVAAGDAPLRFPAESIARTVYVYVVPAATPVFVHAAAEVVATWAPFR